MLDTNVITQPPGELALEKPGTISAREAYRTPGSEVTSAYKVISNSVTETGIDASDKLADIVCGGLDKGHRIRVLTEQALLRCSPDDTHQNGVTIVAYGNDWRNPEHVAFKYDRVRDTKSFNPPNPLGMQVKINKREFSPDQVVIWDPPLEAERWADSHRLLRKDSTTGRKCVVISEMY